MKVLVAETLPNGDRHFVIEAIPAQGDEPAVTEEFTWGPDVALAAAKRETRLLLAEKYGRPAPAPITGMVGKDL